MRRPSLLLVAFMAAVAGCSNAPDGVRLEASADVGASHARDRGDRGLRSGAEPVDPRKGGLAIALGEWAVTPEAEAIRPGRVTFVIENRGTVAHGFEIELEGENGGHGSGDLFKAESRLLQPGEVTRMTVNLQPAVYKIECLVDGHDDLGMEGPLDVRPDAPLVKETAPSRPDGVSIAGFAFDPTSIEVDVGTELTWTNEDPADHTVTSTTGAFGSDALASGDSFVYRFDDAGTYPYRCAIHPEMKGQVKVE